MLISLKKLYLGRYGAQLVANFNEWWWVLHSKTDVTAAIKMCSWHMSKMLTGTESRGYQTEKKAPTNKSIGNTTENNFSVPLPFNTVAVSLEISQHSKPTDRAKVDVVDLSQPPLPNILGKNQTWAELGQLLNKRGNRKNYRVCRLLIHVLDWQLECSQFEGHGLILKAS